MRRKGGKEGGKGRGAKRRKGGEEGRKERGKGKREQKGLEGREAREARERCAYGVGSIQQRMIFEKACRIFSSKKHVYQGTLVMLTAKHNYF